QTWAHIKKDLLIYETPLARIGLTFQTLPKSFLDIFV
ncbi:uncharacterized protein METZ01_LOCUS315883, partial [marine metagenome]